ncbi:hypothetical protein P9265_14915 [Schinkia azotoformans]|uniref:hypothetical protein n=1 Tax=Schinkia azotoformans TaxID=1454 RepID=UPI002E1E9887|nr:hypothetical protein [Schinkia azotoformans]
MSRKKVEENVVEQIIELAAKEAKITTEQSKTNLTKALEEIQKFTLENGEMDLSNIGISVFTRTRIPK